MYGVKWPNTDPELGKYCDRNRRFSVLNWNWLHSIYVYLILNPYPWHISSWANLYYQYWVLTFGFFFPSLFFKFQMILNRVFSEQAKLKVNQFISNYRNSAFCCRTLQNTAHKQITNNSRTNHEQITKTALKLSFEGFFDLFS